MSDSSRRPPGQHDSNSIACRIRAPLYKPSRRRAPGLCRVRSLTAVLRSWPPAFRKNRSCYDHMPTILGYLEDHQVVVVSAPPGSGKSSVLLRCLSNSGYAPVICAQLRHFAATVASAKAGEDWESQVVFTTTRQLLDAFRALPAAFRAVVIDEAHGRTLSTDVLLGMVRAAVATGQMGHLIRVVVCTTGGGRPAERALSDFFFGAPVVAFRLRRAAHPAVEVHYSRGPMLDMVGAVVEEVTAIHMTKPAGDVLAFLPEVVHVEEACRRLQQLGLTGLVACRVHDHLPAELMDDALEPAPGGSRKVVLATDVAETAALVPGITYVVDSGVLSEEPFEMISKEAAGRRLAVAGDASPGHCHRFYMEDEYAGFDEHAVPHVKRDGALFMLALMLKRHAADGMPGFQLLDPSVAPELENVVSQLVAGGYIDKHGNLTEKGEREAYDED